MTTQSGSPASGPARSKLHWLAWAALGSLVALGLLIVMDALGRLKPGQEGAHDVEVLMSGK